MVMAEAAKITTWETSAGGTGVPKGYKQSEVGVIPEDWRVTLLEEIAFVTSGKRLPMGRALTDKETPHPYIRVSDMRNGTIELTDVKFVPEDVFPAIRRYRIYKEDIFISVAGTLGIVGIVPSELDGANLTENADRITNILCSQYYLMHVLLSPEIQSTIESIRTVGAQPKLALTRIRKFPIPLPSSRLEEEAIATALSDADAFITSLEQLISKKRQIRQGAMQELLTGKRRLPGFSGEWTDKSLLELAEYRKELFDDGDWIEAEHLTRDGIRFVQTGNIGIGRFVERQEKKYINDQSFSLLKCKQVEPGDLLICRLADPAGRACVLPNIGERKIVTSVDVTIFRPPAHLANREFLSFVFSTDHWFKTIKDRAGGTTHQRIARGALGHIRISIPDLHEQTAIATVLSDMDAEILALTNRRAAAREIKQGMMQELLTGRVRLV